MNGLPTIFILSNMREIGGAEKSITTLIPELLKSARIHVFVENARHREELGRIGSDRLTITSMPAGNSPIALASGILRIAGHLRRERPDAALANGHKGALMLALLRWLPVPQPRTTAVFIRDFGYSTLRFILRCLPRALFFAPTQAVFDDAVYQSWGLGRARCVVLPNATPMPDGGPPAADDGFIGCCARLVPWKGVDLLLRAFAKARENAPAIKLRVYGERVDAEYFAKLEKIVADLKLGDAVEFHSYTPDIHAVFAKGRFFVVPSLSMRPGPETFSRIIIEAWAHAKPVVAFENGGPRYLIDDGENGYLVAEGDVDALSNRIHKLLADPALCERLGVNGQRKVRESFNPPLIAGALLEKLVGTVPN